MSEVVSVFNIMTGAHKSIISGLFYFETAAALPVHRRRTLKLVYEKVANSTNLKFLKVVKILFNCRDYAIHYYKYRLICNKFLSRAPKLRCSSVCKHRYPRAQRPLPFRIKGKRGHAVRATTELSTVHYRALTSRNAATNS